jgi:cell pole-organizing protein PopZ
MSKTARVPEPSMEEILASIRRIIADDSGAAGQSAAKPAPAAADNSPQMAGSEMAQGDADAFMSSDESLAESDVLELSKPVEPGASPAFTPIRGPDVVFRAEDPPSRAAARPAAATARGAATRSQYGSSPCAGAPRRACTCGRSASFAEFNGRCIGRVQFTRGDRSVGERPHA